MKSAYAALIALALIPSACSSTPNTQTTSTQSTSSALVALGSCEDVEDVVREAAVEAMIKRVDQNLAYALSSASHCASNNAGSGGHTSADAGAAVPGASNSGGSGGSASIDPSEEKDGAEQASGTNNQVVGVDEADFLKNDNKYVYIAANNKLKIIDAYPGNEAKVLSTTDLEGTPNSIFVNGTRVLVYSSIPIDSSDPYYSGGHYSSCNSYGYGCDFTGDGKPTLLTVFDITDKLNPQKVREIRTSGSLINSRRIGNAVHTVVTTPGFRFPNVVEYANVDYCADPAEIWEAYQTLKRNNAKTIRSTRIAAQFPTISDTTFTAGVPTTNQNLMGSCSGFYASGTSDGSAFMTVLSLDLSNESVPSTTTIVSRPGAIYASASALYVAVSQTNDQYGAYGSGYGRSAAASTVHKFSFNPERPATAYIGSGEVKGRVLNQFSMDEYEDHLRIATTTGQTPDPQVHSTLTVLRDGGDKLLPVGVVDNIAPTEDIRSVRFDGPRGFIVTFKKTDPLFVIDLSQPRQPALVGELKIPGFSTYMHMMDESHLLTIGYDADDQGSFAWFAGVRLQIFDVTDMADPKLLHYHVIGSRGSSSEALANHLAFTYFAPKNLLALPMTVCEGGSGGSYGTNMTFNGLMVFDVTLQNGFQLKGKVAHPNDSTGEGYNNSVCSNWWTNASTEVKRSIIMDDWVYSVSMSRLKINNLTDLNTDVGEISLK